MMRGGALSNTILNSHLINPTPPHPTPTRSDGGPRRKTEAPLSILKLIRTLLLLFSFCQSVKTLVLTDVFGCVRAGPVATILHWDLMNQRLECAFLP